MRKFTFLFAIIVLSQVLGFSQGCLPEGIQFTTQAQIDSFQINYPGCTEIEGSVLIGNLSWQGTDINDLSALSVITNIGGSLTIEGNDSLTNLNGLENIITIEGQLYISHNSLTDLTGLSNLTSVGEWLFIGNTLLSDLSGLDNLNYVGGRFELANNNQLLTLEGVENLTTVGGDLWLGGDFSAGSFGNPNLSSLSGLNNLDTIGGELWIKNCPSLTSLGGLESISSVKSIWIEDVSMNSLVGLEGITYIPEHFSIAKSSLGSMTGLNNLVSVGGLIDIYQVSSLTNLDGLSNLNSVGGGLSLSNNNDLTSLAGLDNISTIGGGLLIRYNSVLTSLSGLEGLTSVNGSLWIDNSPELANLTGLNNLLSVGGYVYIDQVSSLTNLDELSNLNSVGEDLILANNSDLTSLAGLNNISTIGGDLVIVYNSALTDCAVQGVCTYLAAPNGEIQIHDNATGCNSQEEVEAACTQPCLPEGIQFTTQAQIDSFPINHPWCNMIEGDVLIGPEGYGSTDIHDLSALNGITSFGGDLVIKMNDSLTNLNGLKNVTSINGNFNLSTNHGLTSLTGLENLTTIQGYLCLNANHKLQTLNGLNHLQSIQGNLDITQNALLSKLKGLDSLLFIGGRLYIFNNPLEDLDELSGVTLIKGDIYIRGNHNLISIDGLSNIDMDSVSDLSIYDNTSLSICNTQNICNYLQDPNGVVQIFQNAAGCNSPAEVASDCGFTIDCLPYGDYYFISQKDIDDFPQNYPGCSQLGGDVVITGDDIVDLSGLETVESIDGDLSIGHAGMSCLSVGNPLLSNISGLNDLDSIGGSFIFRENPLLSNLSGLNQLSYIGGDLAISNSSLTNLSGLNQLNSIGGSFYFGGNPLISNLSGLNQLNSIGGSFFFGGSPLLSNLSGLNQLSYIGGDLTIYASSLTNLTGLENLEFLGQGLFIGNYSPYQNLSNPELVSLDGIENIAANSIDTIAILNNPKLATCHVNSICNFLGSQGGHITISYNAQGCNTIEQVSDSCSVGIDEVLQGNNFIIYPNPVFDQVNISGITNYHGNIILRIFNSNGSLLDQKQYTSDLSGKMEIHLNAYKAGMYFIQLQAGDKVITKKISKL